MLEKPDSQYVAQLEKAVLEAECVLADWEAAKRKGYIPDTTRVVFEAADAVRRKQAR
ncbi:MAG: hypothetical protein V2I43_27035 [Parvularcula sp.]|jgi:hypothetical protein|nr:hypothetical protein [Parvularcula sp.]